MGSERVSRPALRHFFPATLETTDTGQIGTTEHTEDTEGDHLSSCLTLWLFRVFSVFRGALTLVAALLLWVFRGGSPLLLGVFRGQPHTSASLSCLSSKPSREVSELTLKKWMPRTWQNSRSR